MERFFCLLAFLRRHYTLWITHPLTAGHVSCVLHATFLPRLRDLYTRTRFTCGTFARLVFWRLTGIDLDPEIGSASWKRGGGDEDVVNRCNDNVESTLGLIFFCTSAVSGSLR
ncbi:hypothetical protein DE146DRAFT_133825 [Phaeosphaeria sp. MPI-PUGE-AT-0046c]|nr:hypothetical protein DE146DRAFT_133825 [Phaeosphaeria sp. MPI-PUGE-AT-0046c]